MSGKPAVAQSTFILPPIDGLNLIDPPTQLQATEARQLDNYWITDAGIRQIPDMTQNFSYGSSAQIGFFFSYIDTASATERMLYGVGNKIYRLDNPTDSTSTDITGAAVISTNVWFPCYFNKRIFLFNGDNTPLVHDRGAGNVSAFSATGPTVANLCQATGYKNRMYCVDQFTTSVWYGGVDAFSGTFTQLDLGTVFQTSGFLMCAFNWTLNQGVQNEELLVFINSTGEVLVYSGDYPAALNWQLIARARIPLFVNTIHNQPFVRVPGDVYISTMRGLIAISSVVTGALASRPLFTLTRKIRDIAAVSVPSPVIDYEHPYLYAQGTDGNLYILNYERGAWSRIPLTGRAGAGAGSLAIFRGHLMIGTAPTDGKIYNIDLSGAAGSGWEYVWRTPFFDFGSNLQKHSKTIRVVGRNLDNGSVFKNTVSVSNDFVDPASPTTDTRSTTVSADTDTVQELAPPGMGRRLSYVFQRSGVSSINERNEIQGFEVFYEEGGAY